MRIGWDFQGLGKPFEPFIEWLKRTEHLDKLSSAKKEERPKIIRSYLRDQGLIDIVIGEYKSGDTSIKFRITDTGKYWHVTTWAGCYQRSLKRAKVDANQTIILEPLIEDVMKARGTPAIRIEGSSNQDRKVYFYSERYQWICCQSWKSIRKSSLDSNGNVISVSKSNWLHDFRSICGQTEFIQNLIWNKFKGVVDEDWEYESPRDPIPCTSFDGYRGEFNINNILTGNTTGFTLKSAPNKTEYLKEILARQGYCKTGRPWILDEKTINLSKWTSKQPIPFFWDHPEFGRERLRTYWGHLFDDDRIEKRLDSAWDRTEFIKNRFSTKGYEIDENWHYGDADKDAANRPIPFRHRGQWYRMSWSYFNSGIRVESNLYFYFVTLEVNEVQVLKLGITQNEIHKRYPKRQVKDIHYLSEARSEPQIKEVETIMLYTTRKYSAEHLLPLDFAGRTESRTMSMDIQKTIQLARKVFADIDRKFAALPAII